MNFDLSEDEEMFKALAERFIADHYDIESRRAFLAQPQGFSREKWLLLGELGLISAPLPEDAGGLGLDATGIATVFEALGHGLSVEPLIENVVLAGRLFAASAPPDLAAEWLEGIVSGQTRVALAHGEARARGSALWVETTATRDADGAIRLNGLKPFVPAGSGADGLIVSARQTGSPGDADGVGLFFVPADAPGLETMHWTMADGSGAASLTLNNVPVTPGSILTGGAERIAEAQPLANLARSAEALGVMRRLFAETQDYLRTREQFGQKLSQFQAIQHRMVAQYAAIEQCRGLLNHALVSEGTDHFVAAVDGLRAFIGPASVDLGHEMIQFHGGMGVSDELPIGQGHKRLLVLSRWPDTPEAALDRFAKVA